MNFQGFLVLAPLLLITPLAAQEPVVSPEAGPAPDGRTRVVMLGTGNPAPDPTRSGPAVAVVVDDRAYVIDCGPGVVRQMAAAFLQRGIEALRPPEVRHLFITHLHSDHTLGCPDLLISPWAIGPPGRRVPLEVWGPKGTARMFAHITEAFQEDIAVRTGGLTGFDPAGSRAQVTEIEPGLIYEDELVRVTARRVPHPPWEDAFAYRFDTPDRSIVISGDAAESDAIAELCNGCDLLIHEVMSPRAVARAPEHMRQYHRSAHTMTDELGRLATRARPGTLILYHIFDRPVSGEAMAQEVRAIYPGRVVVAADLEVY